MGCSTNLPSLCLTEHKERLYK